LLLLINVVRLGQTLTLTKKARLSPRCGSTAAGFETWKKQFAGEAQARVVSASTIAALMATTHSTATITGQSKLLAIQKVSAAPSFSHSRSLRGLCEFCQVLRSSVRT
jgi:hypothetical protein